MPRMVLGQDFPHALYQTSQFNSTADFRQSLCGRQHLYNQGEISNLENVLEGLELRPILRLNQYFRLDAEGKIDEEYPGLAAILLDEIARRGKFTWRNSFATMERPIADKTFTELLLWSADTYDLSVSWWDQTIERVSSGIAYPESWYDSSLILVGKKPQSEDEDDVFNAWSWLAPFDYEVWGLILATFVFSGLVYVFMVKVDPYTDKRPASAKKGLAEAVFDAAMGFAGYFEFDVQTHPARLYQFSLAMFGLLLSSAYTANLASFLVVRNAPRPSIEGVGDAVRSGAPICVFGGTPPAEELRREHPDALLVEKMDEQETYRGVLNEECKVALSYAGSWLTYERDANTNSDCQLEWVGRKFRDTPAGFATMSDSGTKCTSLLRDVLSLHLMKMKNDGFFEQAWEQHLSRIETIDCADAPDTISESSSKRRHLGEHRDLRRSNAKSAASGTGEAQRLSITNMGGVFLMHGVLSLLAIVFALVHRFYGKEKQRRKQLRRQKGALNVKSIIKHDLEIAAKEVNMSATREMPESIDCSLSDAVPNDHLEQTYDKQDEQMITMKRINVTQKEHTRAIERITATHDRQMESLQEMHARQEQQMDQLKQQIETLTILMANTSTKR